MSKFIINGGRKLYGEITAESAKNALLPLLSACVLYEGKVTFLNVPKLKDVEVMLEIINYLGGKHRFEGNNLTVDCSSLHSYELPCELTKKIRASIFMIGAIIARFRKAYFCKPGGCDIGERPIDIHLSALRCLGVEICGDEFIYCRADILKGAEITLKYKSVGATITALLSAILADGKTVIRNVAKEPEISSLIKLLKSFGAKIKGVGTSTIIVEGVKKLNKEPIVFLPVSDRIEVGTYALAVMSTGGEIIINNANFIHNVSLFKKIQNNACKIVYEDGKIYIKSSGVGNSINTVKTAPYPHFPTDLQPQISAYATTLKGESTIIETVFENRFNHFKGLTQMGAKVLVSGNVAKITGVERLVGQTVSAYDLRGGASMVIAGLKADGVTVVENASVIDRGYYNFKEKLTSLGAKIQRT